jgi:glycosyltransferase involved in cell wall biosynthesis
MAGFEPDIVHTHLGRANLRGGAAAKKAGVVWVLTMHLRWKEREMLGADGVVCIAGWQREEIPDKYRGVIATIWNWYSGKPGPRAGIVEERTALRQVWGCAEGTVVFGSVGRLHAQKGMDLLIKAFLKAFAAGEDVRLVLVGEGKDMAALRALAGGDARVFFAGYQERVEGYFAAFDVYVSAARYEPFGLTLLEAMQARRALICTRTEGPSEFLAGHDVRWVAKADVGALAAALRAEFEAGRREVGHDRRGFALSRGVGEVLGFYENVKAHAC